MSTALVPATPQGSLIIAMAQKYGLQPEKFLATIKATVFPADRQASNEQLAAFLTVAKQYDLNPFIKEIYAFPSKGGGIVPIVSIDGWCSLINRQPQMDGLEFEDELKDGKLMAVTCKIYRKDRSHPMSVTEYMSECNRSNDVWSKWPSRMLRHKALIQCARYAFALSGIYDPDEAERIGEGTSGPEVVTYETPTERTQLIAGKLKEFVAAKVAPSTSGGTPPTDSKASEQAQPPQVPPEAQKPVSEPPSAKEAASQRTSRVDGQPLGGRVDPPTTAIPERRAENVTPPTAGTIVQQVVKVTDAELRNRKGNKGQYWLLTCTIPEMPNVGELGVHVWDKKLFDYVKGSVGKECDFGLSRTEKDEAVFYALEEIYKIGDQVFEGNKPAMTAATLGFE